MQVSVFDAPGHLSFEQRERPVPGDHDVLIEVLKAGICGSEVHAFNGTHPFRKPPSILGHELVGRITEVGKAVESTAVGDLVTVEPHYGCDHCDRCLEGRYNLCQQKTILGTQAWPGAFAEYLRAPARTVYRLNPTLPLSLAALAEPLAVGVHAVRVAALSSSKRIAILGSGTIGLMTAVAAHHTGVREIYMTDAVDRNLAMARELVGARTINVASPEGAEQLASLADQMDITFINAGFQSVLDDALKLTRRQGSIVSIALFEHPMQIDLNAVMVGELNIHGSSMYVREDVESAIALLESRQYPLEKIITHHFGFSAIDQAMEVAVQRRDNPIKVMIDMPASRLNDRQPDYSAESEQ